MAQEKKKKIEILVQTTADRQPARVGDVIEVAESEAEFLIGKGLAKESKAALKKHAKPASKGKAPAAPAAGKPGQPESTPVTPAAPGESK